jgi:hypothetical protein
MLVQIDWHRCHLRHYTQQKVKVFFFLLKAALSTDSVFMRCSIACSNESIPTPVLQDNNIIRASSDDDDVGWLTSILLRTTMSLVDCCENCLRRVW